MTLSSKENEKNILQRIFKNSKNRKPGVTFGRIAGKQKIAKVVDKEKKQVDEFDDHTDFILTAILIAVMKVNPGIRPEMAISKSLEWARRLGTPNSIHLWRKQAIRINRTGMSAEVSKMRRELRKLL